MKVSQAKSLHKPRLKPYQLAAAVLFVGWGPSFLLAYYSYSVLSPAVQANVLADAESLAGSLSQHIENELEHTGETMDYYRTLPATLAVLQPKVPAAAAPAPTPVRPVLPVGRGRHAHGSLFAHPPSPLPEPAQPAATPAPSAQEWLNSIFYPQKRIDGMFLTDAAGRLLAAIPQASGAGAAKFTAAPWMAAESSGDASWHVSPVYARASDGRSVASVVVSIRDQGGKLLGFLGADVLVERIGRRLRAIEMVASPDTTIQIIDQNGRPLFTHDLAPATGAPPLPADLLLALHTKKGGVDERMGRLYVFSPLRVTHWIALLDRPADLVYKPVHDLLRQTLLLVAWLAVGTAAAACLLTAFYRRQLQNSLRIEQGRVFNEKILANMPVGIALIDPTGASFLQFNETFLRIARSLGAVGDSDDPAGIPFTGLAIASREVLARVLHFGVPFQAIDHCTQTVDGQTRYLTINLLRLRDSQQSTLGVLCLAEDSTAAVTLRQELMSANAAKDQFLAQLSHELRNPLSPVITMVAELERIAAIEPEARQPLEIIRRNVELEARLIDDLLDVTRISNGKLQLNRSLVDAHRTWKLALEICQREIDEKKLAIHLDLAAANHFVQADPARLQQVFWNLLKNAIKFSPEGGSIAVRTLNLPANPGQPAKPATHVDFLNIQKPAAAPAANGGPAPEGGVPGETLRIELSDEGIGIEPQHLARIFKAFDQGQSSITQRFGGLGLGLAISKAMVEAHGGQLRASSEGLGKGATFTIDLAACPAPSETPEAAPAPPQPEAAPAPNGSGLGARILVVDDHADTCLGMQRLLTRRGYQVSVAHSVAEALAAAERSPFDLLISDLGLPDGTGFDLMHALRSRGGPPGIALSGYGMEGDVARSREAGFSEHLIKPVTLEHLEEAMRHLLGTTGA